MTTLNWLHNDGSKAIYCFNTKQEKKVAVDFLLGRTKNVERKVEVAPQTSTECKAEVAPQTSTECKAEVDMTSELEMLRDHINNKRVKPAFTTGFTQKVEPLEVSLYKEGKLEWQQLIQLYCFLDGISNISHYIRLNDWKTKTVKRYKELGAKSPKLSKVLTHLGLSERRVSDLLSTSSKKVELSYVTGEEDAVINQGNSTHFNSCQSSDPRSVGGAGSSYNKVGEDLQWSEKGELFLWVIGESMSISEEGFIARAKLRTLYFDNNFAHLAGLYIDRPYGDSGRLMESLPSLVEWWAHKSNGLPIYIAPVWQREDGAGNDFEAQYSGNESIPLYCPSAKGGYQDTMSQEEGPYTFFNKLDIRAGSLVYQAYTSRDKVGSVYHSSSYNVKYNAQKRVFSSPKCSLPVRREWGSNPVAAKMLQQWIKLTGIKPCSTVALSNSNTSIPHISFDSKELGYIRLGMVDNYYQDYISLSIYSPTNGNNPLEVRIDRLTSAITFIGVDGSYSSLVNSFGRYIVSPYKYCTEYSTDGDTLRSTLVTISKDCIEYEGSCKLEYKVAGGIEGIRVWYDDESTDRVVSFYEGGTGYFLLGEQTMFPIGYMGKATYIGNHLYYTLEIEGVVHWSSNQRPLKRGWCSIAK